MVALFLLGAERAGASVRYYCSSAWWRASLAPCRVEGPACSAPALVASSHFRVLELSANRQRELLPDRRRVEQAPIDVEADAFVPIRRARREAHLQGVRERVVRDRRNHARRDRDMTQHGTPSSPSPSSSSSGSSSSSDASSGSTSTSRSSSGSTSPPSGA